MTSRPPAGNRVVINKAVLGRILAFVSLSTRTLYCGPTRGVVTAHVQMRKRNRIDCRSRTNERGLFLLVFAHNDLLAGNILLDQSSGEVHLIDFEYGTPRTPAHPLLPRMYGCCVPAQPSLCARTTFAAVHARGAACPHTFRCLAWQGVYRARSPACGSFGRASADERERASEQRALDGLALDGLARRLSGCLVVSCLVLSCRSPLVSCRYGGMNYRGFDIANHWNEWARRL